MTAFFFLFDFWESYSPSKIQTFSRFASYRPQSIWASYGADHLKRLQRLEVRLWSYDHHLPSSFHDPLLLLHHRLMFSFLLEIQPQLLWVCLLRPFRSSGKVNGKRKKKKGTIKKTRLQKTTFYQTRQAFRINDVPSWLICLFLSKSRGLLAHIYARYASLASEKNLRVRVGIRDEERASGVDALVKHWSW